MMGFGTFDRVHPGHFFYLSELKKIGDELIVVVARDVNVKRMKGKRPYFNENQRRLGVIETGLADRVILGNKKDFFKIIRDFKPSVLGFGYDQWVNMDVLKKLFPKIEMVRLGPYHPHKFKSSLIKTS